MAPLHLTITSYHIISYDCTLSYGSVFYKLPQLYLYRHAPHVHSKPLKLTLYALVNIQTDKLLSAHLRGRHVGTHSQRPIDANGHFLQGDVTGGVDLPSQL